jgi:hypothetical protein
MASKNPRIDRDWRGPIRRSEVATDFGITLARIQWDLFATMTFAGRTAPHRKIAYGLAFRWLQELAKKCGRPYNRLLIALRGEEGEENGRFHFHCLVGGTLTRNYHTLRHQAEWLWKIQTGGARVDVRQYDRSLAGAAYVVKCLGANTYELNKFSFANSVTLSSSIFRLIAAMDRVYERRRGPGHMKNRARDETVSVSAGMVAVPA